MHGKTFKVQCGIDHAGGDLKSTLAHSLAECMHQCAETDGCVDVSLSGVACYMKSTLGKRLKNSGVVGAKLLGHVDHKPVPKVAGNAVTHTNVEKAYTTEIVTVTARHEARHVHQHLHRHDF